MIYAILLYLGIILVVYELLVLAVSGLVTILRAKIDRAIEYEVLSVRVSKENESGPIVAEQVFQALHGIYEDIPWWRRLAGKQTDRVSFEIANVSNSIRFYIRYPKRLKNLVEGQIYAQYPDVEIEIVDDFATPRPAMILPKTETRVLAVKDAELERSYKKTGNMIDPLQFACGIELSMDSEEIYPIKRYPQFEDKLTRVAVDPLSGITATLSRLNSEHDEAWIQLIVRPLGDSWRIVFLRAVKILNSGFLGTFEWASILFTKIFCTRNSVNKFLFFPLYSFLWLKGIKAQRGKLRSPDGFSGPEDIEATVDSRHDRETAIQAAADKVVKLLYEAKIRVVYLPKDGNKSGAVLKLKEIAGAFKQFLIPNINGFVIGNLSQSREIAEKFQKREMSEGFLLNTEELATIYHLPNLTVKTPGIYWVRSKKLEPPSDLPEPKKVAADERLTMLGRTNYRGIQKTFGIKIEDRRRHMYIIGKTGMGKSTLLENMIFSDIQEGKGVAVVDPHGDLAERVLTFVPPNRTNDVILFDPADRDFPVSFNMLENVDPSFNSVVASGLVGIFKKIYADSWGPRLEHILRNTILSLLAYPDTTMLGITRILQDHVFRGRVVRKIEDPIVRSFWVNEFELMQPKMRSEAISPILNKVGQFLSSPIIRNIVGQPKSSINLRWAMDNGKIVIVNLSKGRIGEDNSSLLGAMMITKFQLDAMSRADIAQDERKDFYLYVDEFQNFATDSFATILSEARKYRLNLTMANQYIAQMPDEVRDAVFGNVGTILAFQVGYDDAEYLMQQFAEEVTTGDLVSLSKYTAYSRLLIDGMPSKTFSLDTLSPPEIELSKERAMKVIRTSRERYAKKREMVEDKIRRWSVNTEIKSLGDGKNGGDKSKKYGKKFNK